MPLYSRAPVHLSSVHLPAFSVVYPHISLTPISLHLSPDITLPIAVLSGGASRIHRTNVSDGLRMEGGVNLLVPLLGKAESSEELERAMVLLGSCLYGNAKNIKVGSFSMLHVKCMFVSSCQHD